MRINRQDTNGVKPLLAVGELGYDNYQAGGDKGRVYVGRGDINIPLANKAEADAAVTAVGTHAARVNNPHSVTKIQVGLSNVDNTADSTKVVASAGKWTTGRLINGTTVDGTVNITTSQWGASRNITIGNTLKTVNGSGDISWTLTEIGAIGTSSPAFTGVPTAPTAPVNNNSNQIATTAYVASQVANTAVILTGDQTVSGVKTFSSNIVGNITGNSGTATTLQTARTIGGVSFDGTANINLPGVNAIGNQNTTGNSATATNLATARTINGVAFDGSANITITDNTKLTKTNPVITGSITEQVYNLTGTAINPVNGTIQYKTVSANTTFTETLTSGQSVLLRLINASNYTITFPTITWVGAAAPTLTANCVIVIWKEQSTLYGAFVGSLV